MALTKRLFFHILGKSQLVKNCRFFVNDTYDKTRQSENYISSSSESDEEKSSSFEDGSDGRETEIKNKILAAALNNVHNHGWSHHAIAAGAQEIGCPGVAHGMFPRGGIELVNYFYVTCNEELSQDLNRNPLPARSKPPMITEFLHNSLQKRLKMILPYIDTWTQALALMTLPTNVPDSTRNLQALVDDVWYYAGDRSADFSWYTKRIGLAGVYTSTQLVLIQDTSENYCNTWDFLSRRVKQMENASDQFEQTHAIVDGLPGFLESSALTLKNILGLRNMVRRF